MTTISTDSWINDDFKKLIFDNPEKADYLKWVAHTQKSLYIIYQQSIDKIPPIEEIALNGLKLNHDMFYNDDTIKSHLEGIYKVYKDITTFKPTITDFKKQADICCGYIINTAKKLKIWIDIS